MLKPGASNQNIPNGPLQKLLESIDQELTKQKNDAIETRNKLKSKNDPDYKLLFTDVKPLFKQWLELRCDIDDIVGGDSGSQPISDNEKSAFTNRCNHLLSAIQALKGGTSYFSDFKKWLLDEVKDTQKIIMTELTSTAPTDQQKQQNLQQPDGSVRVPFSDPKKSTSISASGSKGKQRRPFSFAKTARRTIPTSPRKKTSVRTDGGGQGSGGKPTGYSVNKKAPEAKQ